MEDVINEEKIQVQLRIFHKLIYGFDFEFNEEDVELINSHAKQFGKEEVAALVQQNKQRDGQHELQYSD